MESSRNVRTEQPIRALVVCHAGAEIGLGHLTRALVVADALVGQLAAEVCCLIQGEHVRRRVLDALPHRFIPLEADLGRAVMEKAATAAPNLVVFDLHSRLVPDEAAALLSHLRDRGMRLIGVDCLLEYCDALDLVWIPAFRVDAAFSADCSAPVHFGWDSFLLRRTRHPHAWSPGARVLVLTGGSDVAGLGRTLPHRLDVELPAGSEVHWVRGPFAPVPILPPSPRLRWRILSAPDGLDDLIVEAHYALAVYGVSVFELLQYGVPSVVFSPYGEKDVLELALLADEGVAWTAVDAADAVHRLKALMRDDSAASKLARRSMARLSDRGVDRLVGRIRDMFG